VPFLHGVRNKARKDCTKYPERMDVQEETSSETGMYEWKKGPKLKEATMSEEGEAIR
jgi:hypothetical protein